MIDILTCATRGPQDGVCNGHRISRTRCKAQFLQRIRQQRQRITATGIGSHLLRQTRRVKGYGQALGGQPVPAQGFGVPAGSRLLGVGGVEGVQAPVGGAARPVHRRAAAPDRIRRATRCRFRGARPMVHRNRVRWWGIGVWAPTGPLACGCRPAARTGRARPR